MSALTRNVAAALKGGGAKFIIKQIQRNATTGAFEPFSGTDCLGSAAGTWHEPGSMESTDIPRDANGHHKPTLTIIEWDTARRNLLLSIAPYSASAAAAKPDALSLEDGTVIEDASGATEDTTLPYWAIIIRGTPLADGDETAFFAVAQAERAGGAGASKAGIHNKPKIAFNTIDAGGYVCLLPTAAGADSWVDSITAPTLSGINAHGCWSEDAA